MTGSMNHITVDGNNCGIHQVAILVEESDHIYAFRNPGDCGADVEIAHAVASLFTGIAFKKNESCGYMKSLLLLKKKD